MKGLFDTIVAVATPPGTGAISIVKISGKDAFHVSAQCFRNRKGNFVDLKANNRKILYGYAINPTNSEVLDECLLLVMAGPYSYTGEDVVEFHCHGGSIPSYKLVKTLLGLGLRQAEPGEFTLRAFLHGKKDLVEAEAVNSLVSATNDFLHRNAIYQLKGYFSKELETFFERLRNHYIALEADINFPDDVDVGNEKELYELLRELYTYLKDLCESYVETKPLREGIKAIILGKPNVGKSTFLNKLLNYERAIVTPHPGTTRDFISETISLAGLTVNLIDTAGIRETDDPIEKKGIEATIKVLSEADVVFLIFDASQPLTEEDYQLIRLVEGQNKRLVFALLNKIDKGVAIERDSLPENFYVTFISLKSGEGFSQFKELFKKNILEFYGGVSHREMSLTIPRHYELTKNIIDILEQVLKEPPAKDKALFAIKEVLALYDRIVGRNIPFDEIEQIFSNFCIGK